MSTAKKRVVVLGAGFGGAYTYRHLHKELHDDPSVELVVVNATNYFLFTPLLHEVATGGVAPGVVTEPLRKVLGCCLQEFYLGEVTRLDFEAQKVETTVSVIGYDYLVVALGAATNYYGVPGAQEFSFSLKTLRDAVRLKNHVIECFEAAAREKDSEKRRRMLQFVVIGGGSTGVELTAELTDFTRGTFRELYGEADWLDEVGITLIDLSDTLLPRLPEKFGKVSREVLERRGVTVKLNTSVTEVSEHGVTCGDGEVIATDTPIWVAGIMPQPVVITGEGTTDRAGRLMVNECLQLPKYKNVFALGDMAYFINPGHDEAVPPLAQVATRQAKGVARNVVAMLQGEQPTAYHYKHAGDLLSLGHWMGIANLKKVFFTGGFAWWMWRTVYLFKLLSFRKKVKVAVDWTFDLFMPRDIAEI